MCVRVRVRMCVRVCVCVTGPATLHSPEHAPLHTPTCACPSIPTLRPACACPPTRNNTHKHARMASIQTRPVSTSPSTPPQTRVCGAPPLSPPHHSTLPPTSAHCVCSPPSPPTHPRCPRTWVPYAAMPYTLCPPAPLCPLSTSSPKPPRPRPTCLLRSAACRHSPNSPPPVPQPPFLSLPSHRSRRCQP